jgi:hypothetical protein
MSDAKKAKSAAERKAEEAKRNRDQGLVRKSIWVYPDDWPAILEYAAKLKAKRGAN